MLFYIRETGLGSVLLEVDGVGKLGFPVSQQRAERISATSTQGHRLNDIHPHEQKIVD